MLLIGTSVKTPVGTGATPGPGAGTAAAGIYRGVKKLLVTVAQSWHMQLGQASGSTDGKVHIKRLIENNYFYCKGAKGTLICTVLMQEFCF